MPKSSQLISLILIFFLAACAQAPTSPASTEAPITQAPITEAPITEAPVTEAPATEAPTEAPAEPQDYFEGFPPEFQDIQLPGEILVVLQEGGSVVSLPADPAPLADELTAFADTLGLDLAPYDLGRVVEFTSEEYRYIAAPVNAEFFASNFKEDFAGGELVGLVYDEKGAFAETPEVYEVRFFDDQATLSSPSGKDVTLTVEAGEFFWTAQDVFKEMPVAVFIKGSCYLCWSLDNRCGCLVCK